MILVGEAIARLARTLLGCAMGNGMTQKETLIWDRFALLSTRLD